MTTYIDTGTPDIRESDHRPILADSHLLAWCINALASECHGRAKAAGWWNDLATGEPLERNKGELVSLIHSELSEAFEGVMEGSNDAHLPTRSAEEVELADTLIRLFDFAGAYQLNIGGTLVERLVGTVDRTNITGEYLKKRDAPMLAWAVNELVEECHNSETIQCNWSDAETGEPLERNKGELIAIMHSKLSRALEGIRKNHKDTRFPARTAEEAGFAETLIHIFDYAGAYNLDLGGALVEKLAYNLQRSDHKPENRAKEGGKKI
jgi:hypothetical protein